MDEKFIDNIELEPVNSVCYNLNLYIATEFPRLYLCTVFQYSCCSALCSCPGGIVRISIIAPQGNAPKCPVRSFWWFWLHCPDSSPVSKSASWRTQGSLNQWDECLRSFQFWRVHYSLTDKFWGSERSQAAALKWISFKNFENHHVLSKKIKSEHEQWPRLTLPCLLRTSPSATGTEWDPPHGLGLLPQWSFLHGQGS